jgi:MYXO-CTERM domain-containing protein
VAGFTGNGGGGAGTGGEGGQSTDASSGGMGGDAAIGGMNGALADAGPTPANPSRSGGCSCSLAESSPGASVFGLVVAVAGLMTRGRRRAKSSAARKAS